MNQEEYDIFVSRGIYPDAESLFEFQLKALEEIKHECLIVLDTNVLLFPYTVGKQTLQEIRDTYLKLIIPNRLFIPGQVAREFVKNRPNKIAELYQKISRKMNDQGFQKLEDYPLFESMSEFKDAKKLSAEIEKSIKEYRKKLEHLLNKIKGWTWNDPVSLVYQELFKPEVILDLKIDDDLKKQIKQDLSHRKTHSIAPGYKDDSKSDRGIGDLIIWKTILKLGSDHNKSIIFVSNDQKADWWHRSEKHALYPRYELVEEFRHASHQQSFHIITLSDFLELYGASQTVVEEVRVEEVRREEQSHSIHIVHSMNISLYSDSQCQKIREGVSGILLEARQMPGNTLAGYQIFPTTRTYFKVGMRVSWHWNLRQVWEETWYRHPESNVIHYAWTSSAEFVGQSLDY